jgi:hypothetical protein
MEILIYLICPVFIVVWLFAPYVVSRWQRAGAGKAWQEIGQGKGLTFEDLPKKRSIKLSGEIDGHRIELVIRTIITGGFESWPLVWYFPIWKFVTDLSVGLKTKGVPSRVQLSKHSMIGDLGHKTMDALLDEKDHYHTTGDEAFDKRFYIDGDDAVFAEKALSDSSIRAQMIALHRQAEVTLVKNFHTIDYSAPGMETNSVRLEELLNTLMAWADHLDSLKK